MATTTNLTTLKINYLSQAQYDQALTNGQINADELYFTPSNNAPSVTIQLNGANITSPSFYAPIDSGTSGQILVSEGEGEDPAWVNGELTDENVKMTSVDSSNDYYPILLAPSGITSGATDEIKYSSLNWNPYDGVLSTNATGISIQPGLDCTIELMDCSVRNAEIHLGGFDSYYGHGTGQLYFYNLNHNYRGTLSVSDALTAHRSYTLPNASGTIALTSDIPSTYVSTITTAAGAHTAISNRSGAVTFNVPTTAAHVGAIATTNDRISNAFIDGYNTSTSIKIGINGTNISDSTQYLFGARTTAPVLYNDTTDTTIWTGYTTANKPSAADVTTGTFPGRVIAAADTSYTTAQIRNIILSSSAPGSTSAVNGTVWIQYQA